MPSNRTRMAIAVAGAAIASLIASPANAQCGAIDFEDLPVGTSVTTQYDGVTFDALPDSCGSPTALRIGVPGNGTSSGDRALVIDAGCPDFSPDYIRMTFDDLQREVSFTCGISSGTMEIRAYNNSGSLIFLQFVDTNPAVRTFVRVDRPTADIRRVEIDSTISDFEAIDDVFFDRGETDLVAFIDQPGFRQCVCDSVSIQGIVCGDAYDRDILEIRPVNADQGTPWTEVGGFSSPVCEIGNLYNLNMNGFAGGTYYVRLTVFEECGRSVSDITTIRYDTSPPGIGLDRPAANATVGGTVQLCGAIGDSCPVTWDIKAVGPGGASVLIDQGTGSDCGFLTDWDTSSLAAGNWTIVINAIDECGFTSEFERNITIDPAAAADVTGDGVVNFEDLLLVLASWTPIP